MTATRPQDFGIDVKLQVLGTSRDTSTYLVTLICKATLNSEDEVESAETVIDVLSG